eukprot:COSAG02_NODE_5512_length_4270_cov_12.845361_1_plen_185_part_00
MNVDVIETKSAATELVQDRGDERVVDEVAVDPVPVQCMLVILEVFWLSPLPSRFISFATPRRVATVSAESAPRMTMYCAAAVRRPRAGSSRAEGEAAVSFRRRVILDNEDVPSSEHAVLLWVAHPIEVEEVSLLGVHTARLLLRLPQLRGAAPPRAGARAGAGAVHACAAARRRGRHTQRVSIA